MNNISIYLHIPFCSVRCAYCDFNTYAGLEGLMPAYVRALTREIRGARFAAPPAASPTSSEPDGREAGQGGMVGTVYFGGGTPSLLPLRLLAEVFAALRETFTLTADCEITLEANPGSVDQAYLDGLRVLGVNRLSFGVQSAQASELRLLDRRHTFDQAVEAVAMARAAGVENLNLDLIFGLPGRRLAPWQDTLTRTLALRPEHLSLYALSLEHGTPMHAWVSRGWLPRPDPDLAADMYEWADEALTAQGYAQYEISNWAIRPDYACRHNLQYWRNRPYLGFGAGAHGYIDGVRYSNVLSPRAYIERVMGGRVGGGGARAAEAATTNAAAEAATTNAATASATSAAAQRLPIDRETEMGETMMMGLRLTREGVSDATFRERFGVGLVEAYGQEIEELCGQGLLEWDGERARLTKRGRLLGNRAFSRFV